jgi:hypothetical protein
VPHCALVEVVEIWRYPVKATLDRVVAGLAEA